MLGNKSVRFLAVRTTSPRLCSQWA